jgi:hypothetical protein
MSHFQSDLLEPVFESGLALAAWRLVIFSGAPGSPICRETLN